MHKPRELEVVQTGTVSTLHSEPRRDDIKLVIVIVPAFNEEMRIADTVEALKPVKAQMATLGLQLLVYVVDDGSTDATRARAIAAGADRVVRHKVNRGLGAAVRSGLSAARSDGADIVIKFDADLQHDPGDMLALIEPILYDEADVIYGDRTQRIEYKMPFVRRAGNLVFTRLMRLMTGWPLRDSQPGIFAAERSYLAVFHIPGDYNYTQQILLDAYAKGMRFGHVPVAFRKRITGKSFISLRYPFRVLPQIFWLVVGVRPMKVFMPIGLFFLLLGAIVFGMQITQYFLGYSDRPVETPNLVLGSALFGVQTIFFGILAQLIVNRTK